jgi:hypothetical protein
LSAGFGFKKFAHDFFRKITSAMELYQIRPELLPAVSGGMTVLATGRIARCFFSNQKFQFGNILEGLRWENVDIFLAIWNILRTFGMFYDHLVHFVFLWNIFSDFGIMYQEKSGNPGHVNSNPRGNIGRGKETASSSFAKCPANINSWI